MTEILIPALLRALTAHDRMFDQSVLAELALALEIHQQAQGTYPDSLEALPELDRTALPALDGYDYTREGEGWTLTNAPWIKRLANDDQPEKARRVVLCHPGK